MLWLSLIVIFALVAVIQLLVTTEEDQVKGLFDMLALLSRNGKFYVVIDRDWENYFSHNSRTV